MMRGKPIEETVHFSKSGFMEKQQNKLTSKTLVFTQELLKYNGNLILF